MRILSMIALGIGLLGFVICVGLSSSYSAFEKGYVISENHNRSQQPERSIEVKVPAGPSVYDKFASEYRIIAVSFLVYACLVFFSAIPVNGRVWAISSSLAMVLVMIFAIHESYLLSEVKSNFIQMWIYNDGYDELLRRTGIWNNFVLAIVIASLGFGVTLGILTLSDRADLDSES